jgi:predicted membrane GTPase involved in stress response
MLNNMKGYNMTIEKDYEIMKNKVNKLLEQIDTLVSDFDEKYDVSLSNDLHFKLDEVSDMINDNYADTDFDN